MPNKLQNYQNRKKVKVTVHARSRLSTRCSQFQPNDYVSIATAARYNGKTIPNLPIKQARWVAKHFCYKFNTSQIRVYKNVVFIFAGSHSRTLITVYRLPNWLVEGDNNVDSKRNGDDN